MLLPKTRMIAELILKDLRNFKDKIRELRVAIDTIKKNQVNLPNNHIN